MESPAGVSKPNKGLVIKLAALIVIAGVAGVAVLRGLDVRALIDQALELVRGAGPVAFFAGMAVLPAFGFPLSPFTLSAGSVFAPTMGWPLVLAATWLALSINVTLTYVAARWVARPWLEKLVLRFGYRWPQVKPDGYWDITILVRVTPGPPFFVQSALLGLAQVPLRIYLIGSILIAGLYGTAFVIFGEALLSGKGRMVMMGAGAIAALAVGTQLLRRHYARKKATPELTQE
ncbi:TVP38/TMEM64 family protein [Synoicihabitans lomoniglobus]|uniref:TVP38/TMEM64 family membrane protein n=1 Tax=Synoicihabitans lomoniglobus TaxID=2909285 RepID=A0AAE9ZWU4_9BACT|nr:hypothetical protein [Opitutaceae bacterium LMO-M01]WED65746.1 hypothetical protein PXH66_02660 [Opitutaceae bacterium LMO-M01]